MTMRARLLLDLSLFGALLLAYNPAWTHIALHEWLCVVVIAPLLVHFIVNWEMTMRIVRRFSAIVRATPRVNLVIDGALFVAAVTVTLSGFMVSQVVARAFGIVVIPASIWVQTHSISADATIALLLVHFALHWKWIVNAARRLSGPVPVAAKAADPVSALRVATGRLTVPTYTQGER